MTIGLIGHEDEQRVALPSGTWTCVGGLLSIRLGAVGAEPLDPRGRYAVTAEGPLERVVEGRFCDLVISDVVRRHYVLRVAEYMWMEGDEDGGITVRMTRAALDEAIDLLRVATWFATR